MKTKILDDNKVRMIWKCDSFDDKLVEHSGDENGEIAVPPTFYQNNGTPNCKCGDYMVYLRTELIINE